MRAITCIVLLAVSLCAQGRQDTKIQTEFQEVMSLLKARMAVLSLSAGFRALEGPPAGLCFPGFGDGFVSFRFFLESITSLLPQGLRLLSGHAQ